MTDLVGGSLHSPLSAHRRALGCMERGIATLTTRTPGPKEVGISLQIPQSTGRESRGKVRMVSCRKLRFVTRLPEAIRSPGPFTGTLSRHRLLPACALVDYLLP